MIAPLPLGDSLSSGWPWEGLQTGSVQRQWVQACGSQGWQASKEQEQRRPLVAEALALTLAA